MPFDPTFNPLAGTATATCPSCGGIFHVTRGNKRYCNFRCLKKAERQRNKESYNGAVVVAGRHWVKDPTAMVLATHEQVLLASDEDGKGFTFFGTIPQWTPSDPRVLWGKGQGGVWNMIFFKTT